jgi:hypothetical protein
MRQVQRDVADQATMNGGPSFQVTREVKEMTKGERFPHVRTEMYDILLTPLASL